VYYHFFHRALCYSRMVPVWHIVQFQKGCGYVGTITARNYISTAHPTHFDEHHHNQTSSSQAGNMI
jgi:hypothetical protein